MTSANNGDWPKPICKPGRVAKVFPECIRHPVLRDTCAETFCVPDENAGIKAADAEYDREIAQFAGYPRARFNPPPPGPPVCTSNWVQVAAEGEQVTFTEQVDVLYGVSTDQVYFWSNGVDLPGSNNATGVVNGVEYEVTTSGTMEMQFELPGLLSNYGGFDVPFASAVIQVYEDANYTITFASPVLNPVLVLGSIGGSIRTTVNFSDPVRIVHSEGDLVVNSPTSIGGGESSETYVIVEFPGRYSTVSFDVVDGEFWMGLMVGAGPTNNVVRQNVTGLVDFNDVYFGVDPAPAVLKTGWFRCAT